MEQIISIIIVKRDSSKTLEAISIMRILFNRFYYHVFIILSNRNKNTIQRLQ